MSPIATEERLAPCVSLHRLDDNADVLLVTSGWPHQDEPRHRDGPRYGIFLRRQVDSLRAVGVTFDVLFVRGYASSRAYVDAARLLAAGSLRRDRGYRLVHAHGGESAVAAAFDRRAPLLVSYCGDDLLGTPRIDGKIPTVSRVRRRLIRQTSRLATETITKSRQMEAYLPARRRARNTVLPNGVDSSMFAPLDRVVARRRLGWDAEEPVVLFAADPSVARKRHWLAREACERAAHEVPRLRLYIADSAPPNEMPVLMSAADCLLLTSSVEGSPNVVKESVMCNLPVVSTRVGDVEEVLAGVEPSKVCGSDPDELASAIVSCLRHPRRSNGRAASAWLAAEVIAGRLCEIYERLLARA